MPETPPESWHMSKSFNLSFLFGVMIQTATVIWFIANLNNGVVKNREDIVRNETRIEQLSEIVQTQAVTMARMDENIKAIRTVVESMAVSKP